MVGSIPSGERDEDDQSYSNLSNFVRSKLQPSYYESSQSQSEVNKEQSTSMVIETDIAHDLVDEVNNCQLTDDKDTYSNKDATGQIHPFTDNIINSTYSLHTLIPPQNRLIMNRKKVHRKPLYVKKKLL